MSIAYGTLVTRTCKCGKKFVAFSNFSDDLCQSCQDAEIELQNSRNVVNEIYLEDLREEAIEETEFVPCSNEELESLAIQYHRTGIPATFSN